MWRELSFFVPGKPCGKGRPRFSTCRGRVHAFTPKATRDYEELVAVMATLARAKHAWATPSSAPVLVKIEARFPALRGWSKAQKVQAEAGLLHPKKPDIDNIAKTILDASNGLVFADDSQVQRLDVRKRYARAGEECGVLVRVVELESAG